MKDGRGATVEEEEVVGGETEREEERDGGEEATETRALSSARVIQMVTDLL